MFATTASTETLNGTISGVILSSPPSSAKWGGETKVALKIVPFSEKESHYEMSLHEECRNPHMFVWLIPCVSHNHRNISTVFVYVVVVVAAVVVVVVVVVALVTRSNYAHYYM